MPACTSLSRAREDLAEEEIRIGAEIEAFEEFFDRVSELPKRAYRADGGRRTAMLRSQMPSSTPGEVVRIAYRETVLAVDHWEEAYGEETALESMANEFGVDVATGLTGGAATWSPLLRSQLRSNSEDAIESRRELRRMVRNEREQIGELYAVLVEIGDELVGVERPDSPFDHRVERLATIRGRLERLADERQTQLNRRETPKRGLFRSLVYSNVDTDHPGLTAIAMARENCDRTEIRLWTGAR